MSTNKILGKKKNASVFSPYSKECLKHSNINSTLFNIVRLNSLNDPYTQT